MTTLIIGDIHGCYDELQALLDRAALSETDEIIAIGDLLDRGPQPREVFEFFLDTSNAQAIQGNHERKHTRAHAGELPPSLAQLLTRWHLGEDYQALLAYIDTLPLHLDLPEALIVHGYYEPNVALGDQEERVLLGTMGAEQRLMKQYERPWYEYYRGEKPIIVGHRDYSLMQKPFIWQNHVYGIDTRCVYGGSLTGLLLPDFRFLSVPARRNYWMKLKARHGGEG